MRAYKTEIKPNTEQITKMNQTFGNCRWVYNAYLAYNQEQYRQSKTFVPGYDYSKHLNHAIDTPEWLKQTSSKATKQAIMNAEKAYKNFFKGNAKFPRFKKKGKANESFYLYLFCLISQLGQLKHLMAIQSALIWVLKT